MPRFLFVLLAAPVLAVLFVGFIAVGSVSTALDAAGSAKDWLFGRLMAALCAVGWAIGFDAGAE